MGKLYRSSEIRKTLNTMDVQGEVVDYVLALSKEYEDKLESLRKVIEINNRVPVPVELRKMVVVTLDTSRNKITINPCDGRVSLKLSHKTTEKVANEIKQFVVDEIMSDSTLPPVTMRGKIKWDGCGYEATLQSDSKKFSKIYRKEMKNE